MHTEGLKIHISEATKTILENLGGFVIEERGDVYLKVSNDTVDTDVDITLPQSDILSKLTARSTAGLCNRQIHVLTWRTWSRKRGSDIYGIKIR